MGRDTHRRRRHRREPRCFRRLVQVRALRHGEEPERFLDAATTGSAPTRHPMRPTPNESFRAAFVSGRALAPLELGLAKSRSDCVNGDGSATLLSSPLDAEPFPPVEELLYKHGLSPSASDGRYVMSVLRGALQGEGAARCTLYPGESAQHTVPKILGSSGSSSSSALRVRRFYALTNGVQDLANDSRGGVISRAKGPPLLTQYPANFLLIVLRLATGATAKAVMGFTHLPNGVVSITT